MDEKHTTRNGVPGIHSHSGMPVSVAALGRVLFLVLFLPGIIVVLSSCLCVSTWQPTCLVATPDGLWKNSVISLFPDSLSWDLSSTFATALEMFVLASVELLFPFLNSCSACTIFLLGPRAVIPRKLRSCHIK